MSAVEPRPTSTFVTTDALLNAFDAKQVGKLKRILVQNHIKYFVNGAGHPVTTEHALNHALGLMKDADREEVSVDLSWMKQEGEGG